MRKEKDFKIFIESSNAADAEERIFMALSMLVSEEDIISYQKDSKISKVRCPNL